MDERAADRERRQNDYIEEHQRRHGKRLDHEERKRKREAREVHKQSAVAQKTIGLKAKMLNKKRRAEKVQMKKTLKAHEERDVKTAATSADSSEALPTYLLDREQQRDAKALSSAVKERRKDKAARYSVPLPQVFDGWKHNLSSDYEMLASRDTWRRFAGT